MTPTPNIRISMNLLSAKHRRRPLSAVVGTVWASMKGSAFLYILVVMLIFGLLGSAVISMYTSAERMTKGVPHEARQARALAESGMRYAVSELRNVGYRPTVINRLNATSYTVDTVGTFELNVFGKWFRSNEDHSGSADIKLDVPEGEVPSDFSIPANVYLLNLESARDALIFVGAWNNDFVGFVPTAPDMSASPLSVSLGDTLVVDRDQPVMIAVQADSAYPADTDILGGGNLRVAAEAADVFPKRNGSFYIQGTLDVKRLYYYETLVDQTTYAEQTKISEDLTVSGSDYVALSQKNHRILATGSAGSTAFGGTEDLSMDFLQNISTPQVIPPPPLDLPADIPSDQMLPDMAPPVESVPEAVDVDLGASKITLGSGAASTYGAVWFSGTITAGGFDVCNNGVCFFNTGIRSFFIVDYNGTGDGFTFALINATDNNANAVGGDAGLLGYAGVGNFGILPPKMALEFDTYTDDVDRNDPNEAGWNHRDVLQFVYWGTAAGVFPDDLDDDHFHTIGENGDTANLKEDWVFTPPSAAIVTKPAIADDGTIYVSCVDDKLYAINPDGTEKDRFDTGDDIFSSPVIDSDSTVYVGTDHANGKFYALDPAVNWTNHTDSASYKWRVNTSSYVRSSPAVDSSDNAFFSTWINDNQFYGVDSGGNALGGWPNMKSGAAVAPYHQADGTVAVDETNDAIYFNTMFTANNGFLHARALDGSAKWASPFDLLGASFSSPTVWDPTKGGDGTIYIGSNGPVGVGYLFAINPNGSEKWRFDFPCCNPVSRPAIGSDGTIYIGNDDNYLYAINPDGTQKWRFRAGGDVRSEPLVGNDGAIYFGSQDTFLYAVDTGGRLLGKYDLQAAVSIPDLDGASYSWDNWIYSASPV